MDDGGFDFIEVTQSADDLHDDGARLFLCHQLVLLQVEVQVIPFTELQHCTEPDKHNTHSYIQRHESGGDSEQMIKCSILNLC